MAVEAEQVTVADSPTSLVDVDSTSPQSLLVRVPSGGSSVFVGPSDVATSSGFEVAAGEFVTADLQAGERLYGIVASGTQTVHVLRSGVG